MARNKFYCTYLIVYKTIKPWFSRFLRHSARKRGEPILITPERGTGNLQKNATGMG